MKENLPIIIVHTGDSFYLEKLNNNINQKKEKKIGVMEIKLISNI